MARWPDFFIVGAMRAGTTSLYEYLKVHPDILMPSVKETHFFSSDYNDETRRNRRTRLVRVVGNEEDYLALFRDASARQIIGEACPTYLANLSTADRIKEKAPQAKIIILLRNPVDRAYSHYLFTIHGRHNPGYFYEAVAEDQRRLGNPPNDRGVYVWPGLYEQQVRRYLDTFGPEQVQIYLYEDLANDNFGLVRDVCSFLGVEFDGGRFFDHAKIHNLYVAPRNSIFKWLNAQRWVMKFGLMVIPWRLVPVVRERVVNRASPKPPLDPKAQGFLRTIYHDDILKLQNLIGRDLSSWLA